MLQAKDTDWLNGNKQNTKHKNGMETQNTKMVEWKQTKHKNKKHICAVYKKPTSNLKTHID